MAMLLAFWCTLFKVAGWGYMASGSIQYPRPRPVLILHCPVMHMHKLILMPQAGSSLTTTEVSDNDIHA
jgi:hypothetical protein